MRLYLKVILFFIICIYYLFMPFSLFTKYYENDVHAALDTVRLRLKWQHQFQFAGYYAAMEKGYYKKAGIDVQFIEASKNDTDDPIKCVLRGEAEFGIAASDLVIMRAKGKPVVALAVIFQHSPLILLAKEHSDIDHVHDLKGKKLMLEPHSEELEAYLKEEGVSVDQLIKRFHKFDPSPLIDGDIDVMSAYISDEPYLLKKAKIPYRLFSPRSCGIDFYGDTLFTSEKQIEYFPDRVKSFLDASLRGWEYAFSHIDEIVKIIQNKYSNRHDQAHLKYEAEQMRKLIMPDRVELGSMRFGRWKHIAETFAKFEMMPDNYTIEGFLYNSKPKSLSNWHYSVYIGIAIIGMLILLLMISFGFIRIYHHYILKDDSTDH